MNGSTGKSNLVVDLFLIQRGEKEEGVEILVEILVVTQCYRNKMGSAMPGCVGHCLDMDGWMDAWKLY